MQAAPTIRRATLDDLEGFADHLVLHARESGEQGSPVFAISRELVWKGVREGTRERWRRGLREPLWGRAWVLCDGEKIVGHCELRGGRVAAELHRATLGMGLQRAYTGRGYGRQLLDAAIVWARDERGLAWIDLGVFANNTPARRLYERAGFVERGVQRDAFRVEGEVSVDDVAMSLCLGGGRAEEAG